MKRLILMGALCCTAVVTGCTETSDHQIKSQEKPATPDTYSTYVDAKGNISRPDNFRQDWVHLGTWFVKNDEHASGPGVHDVYANPSAVAGFKSSGQWPDGTVLVKAITNIKEKQLTTGNAQWAGDPAVWFVMVRDRKNRFPNNAAWGEGWGWALFNADNPDKNVTTTWKGEGFNNCFGCHLPAKATDWVYIDGYPTVREHAKYPSQ